MTLAQVMSKDRIVDRQMNLFGHAVHTIKRAFENPDFISEHLLFGYVEEVRSHEGELQGFNKDIPSLHDIDRRMRKASDIKQTLFDLRVGFSRVTKKEPAENYRNAIDSRCQHSLNRDTDFRR